MIRINLLPSKVRKTRGAHQVTVYVFLGAAALAALLVLVLLGIAAQTRLLEAKIAQTEAASAGLADKFAYLRALTERETRAGRVRGLLQELLPEQAVWIQILNDLADLAQGDLWLTGLQSEPAAKNKPLLLVLEGEAYTKIAVADFLAALEASEHFQDVQLIALTDMKAGAFSQVRFKLKMSYRPQTAAGRNP